eukprot:365806-Chlamydomonas_euryale.AAC.8
MLLLVACKVADDQLLQGINGDHRDRRCACEHCVHLAHRRVLRCQQRLHASSKGIIYASLYVLRWVDQVKVHQGDPVNVHLHELALLCAAGVQERPTQVLDADAVAQRQQILHDLPCGADAGPLELFLVVLHQNVADLVLLEELAHAAQHTQLEALHVHLHHGNVARQDCVHSVHLELADVAVALLKRTVRL